MITLEEISAKYSVIEDVGSGDKNTIHSYIPEYEKLLLPYRNKSIIFVEIGVNQGLSMKMWREYFSNARVIGVDVWNGSGEYIKDLNIEFICADATSKEFADQITFGLDIVCDDGSHMQSDIESTYELLAPKMNKGGLYIIEDLINFEVQKPIFEKMGFEVIDLRDKKGRYDDAIAIKRF